MCAHWTILSYPIISSKYFVCCSPESGRWPTVGKYKVDVASLEFLALPELQVSSSEIFPGIVCPRGSCSKWYIASSLPDKWMLVVWKSWSQDLDQSVRSPFIIRIRGKTLYNSSWLIRSSKTQISSSLMKWVKWSCSVQHFSPLWWELWSPTSLC